MWEAVYSYLSRMVGNRTDAADAAGSLHAKIKNINDNTLSTLQKPRGPAGVYGSLTSNTGAWVTALNVSGKGRLIALKLYQSAANVSAVKVTVDGYILANQSSVGGASGNNYPANDYYLGNPHIWGNLAEGFSARNAEINFKTSLKLELFGATGATSTLYWLYEIE